MPNRNLTLEEYIIYNEDNLDAQCVEYLEELVDLREEIKLHGHALDSSVEIVEEALYNAKELIENIETWVVNELPMTKQKQFRELLDNSNFER